jgi:hypothetical protein
MDITKKYNIVYVLICILFIYLLYAYFIHPLFLLKQIESFKSIDEIDYYVITMRGEDRMKNI